MTFNPPAPARYKRPTTAEIAKSAGVSVAMVRQIRYIEKHGVPELYAEVMSNKPQVSIPTLANIAKLPKDAQLVALAACRRLRGRTPDGRFAKQY